MRNFSLSESEVMEMKAFYQQEMANLRKRLEHVQSIIGKLETGGSESGGQAPAASRTASAPSTSGAASTSSSASSATAAAPKKRGRKRGRPAASAATSASTPSTPAAKPKAASQSDNTGKRGRKSKWGTFILKTLEKENEPMPANELVERARARYNVPEKDDAKLKAAIAGSLYRLQHVNDQIQPHNAEGVRGNVYGLKDWFKGDQLGDQYQSNLRKTLTDKATEDYLASKASSGESKSSAASGETAPAQEKPKKRGRGRPPKSATAAAAPAPTASTGTGKRRGRRRKSETASAPAPAAKPKGRRGRKPKAKS